MRYLKNAGKTGRRIYRSGLLSGVLYTHKLGGTAFAGRPLTAADRILLFDGDGCTDAAQSAEYVSFYEAHAAYILPQRAELLVGTDGKLPLRLFYLDFYEKREKCALDFHLRGENGIISDGRILEKHAEGAYLFSDPEDPEKRTVFSFAVRQGKTCAFVMGVFRGNRAGVFYRALEAYGTPARIKEAILSTSASLAGKLAGCRVKSLMLDVLPKHPEEARERLLRAALLTKHFPDAAANEIRFACTGQEIDGSGAGNGILPLSLCAYLNEGGDERLLSEELPYRQDGIYTKKKETVFWHAMRAAEHAESREGLTASETLCGIFHEDGLKRTFSERKNTVPSLLSVLREEENGRLSADKAFFCQNVLRHF